MAESGEVSFFLSKLVFLHSFFFLMKVRTRVSSSLLAFSET